jgi:hypothetical protein
VLPPIPLPAAGRGGAQHRYVQEAIKKWAESGGYRASIEQEILGGLGSVDVVLVKGEQRIACEVSITTTPAHELGNVQKCLAAGFPHVAVVSDKRATLRKVEAAVSEAVTPEDCARVRYCTPEELFVFLEELDARAVSTEGVVRGYKVKTTFKAVSAEEKKAKTKTLAKVIAERIKRLKRE